MPCHVKVQQFVVRESTLIDAGVSQAVPKIFEMQDVEADKRPLSAADAFHRRLVPLPPIVRKLLCIAIDSMTRKESGHFSNDAASPINHCPECIEQHRPDERQRPRTGRHPSSSPADGERDITYKRRGGKESVDKCRAR